MRGKKKQQNTDKNFQCLDPGVHTGQTICLLSRGLSRGLSFVYKTRALAQDVLDSELKVKDPLLVQEILRGQW